MYYGPSVALISFFFLVWEYRVKVKRIGLIVDLYHYHGDVGDVKDQISVLISMVRGIADWITLIIDTITDNAKIIIVAIILSMISFLVYIWAIRKPARWKTNTLIITGVAAVWVGTGNLSEPNLAVGILLEIVGHLYIVTACFLFIEARQDRKYFIDDYQHMKQECISALIAEFRSKTTQYQTSEISNIVFRLCLAHAAIQIENGNWNFEHYIDSQINKCVENAAAVYHKVEQAIYEHPHSVVYRNTRNTNVPLSLCMIFLRQFLTNREVENYDREGIEVIYEIWNQAEGVISAVARANANFEAFLYDLPEGREALFEAICADLTTHAHFNWYMGYVSMPEDTLKSTSRALQQRYEDWKLARSTKDTLLDWKIENEVIAELLIWKSTGELAEIVEEWKTEKEAIKCEVESEFEWKSAEEIGEILHDWRTKEEIIAVPKTEYETMQMLIEWETKTLLKQKIENEVRNVSTAQKNGITERLRKFVQINIKRKISELLKSKEPLITESLWVAAYTYQ